MSFEKIVKKVSIVRIGLVLSNSGAKQTMLPMSFGFGVYFGSGRQWQSWIHIEDISQIFIHIIKNRLSGIYNGVAPNPLTNYEFTKVISRLRNCVFLIPILRLFFRIIFEKCTLFFQKSKSFK